MMKESKKQMARQIARMNRWEFGEFLKRKRMSRGLSRKELAEEIGFSAAQLQNYEHGSVVAPKLGGMMRIAEAIGVEKHVLFEIYYPSTDRKAGHDHKSAQKR